LHEFVENSAEDKAFYGPTVEGFILGGIFDELVQQPSNIFDVAVDREGGQFYVPLSADNWIACLEALRFSLLPSP